MTTSLPFKVILFSALLQGFLGLLQAYNWVQLGVDLFGQGILLLPFVGTVAVMRGLFISIIALLYVVSVIGALLARRWFWWTCLSAVVLNLLIVLGGLVQGAPVMEAVAWLVIPVVLLTYLMSPTGRHALKRA